MLLHQRTNHADQKQLPQNFNVRVTTSKYVIRGKITFGQSKLNLPGHSLPPRGKKIR